jgi:ABC-type spermidine/putrescine transport system permease subunit I
MKFVMVWTALTVGNFLYQAFRKKKDWGIAAERSFLQGVAVGISWFVAVNF